MTSCKRVTSRSLSDAEMGKECRLLIDNRDSERPGDRGIILFDVSPGDHQRSGVRHHRASYDLDQRAFPGAVFADKRVNLTCTQVEIDAFQGVNAGKGLPDGSRFQ